MNIRIETDGKPSGTKIIDADTGANLANKCYGFDIQGRAGGRVTATLFCFAEGEINAEGEIVEVPRSLVNRASEMAARIGNPAVTAAFAELLGKPMAPPPSSTTCPAAGL